MNPISKAISSGERVPTTLDAGGIATAEEAVVALAEAARPRSVN